MSRHPSRSLHPLFFATTLLFACNGGPGGSGDESSGGSSAGGIDSLPPGNSTTDDPETTTGDPVPTTGDPPTGGTTEDPFVCLADEIKAEVKIPRVMLVLDKSGSMVSEATGFWDADGDPATPEVTRWSSLYSVVESIVTNFEERMDFGATLFPSTDAISKYSALACPVNSEPEVPVGTDQGATILATIPQADDIKIVGGTPAAAGIMTAIGGLPASPDLPPEEDLRYILFVTDGAANCRADAATDTERFETYDEQLPANVTAALAAGVPTFVVGIDIEDKVSPMSPPSDGNPDVTNTFVRLNELAELGGTARAGAEKFYNAADQLELQAALEEISQAITSCTFELNIELTPYQYVRELKVDTDKDPETDPLEYGKNPVTDCATESGWHFTDETRKFIELCGDACTAYKATGEVDITFDCNAP